MSGFKKKKKEEIKEMGNQDLDKALIEYIKQKSFVSEVERNLKKENEILKAEIQQLKIQLGKMKLKFDKILNTLAQDEERNELIIKS